ncbi:MAG: NAD-dependent epimerase/dehydratase family protein [Bacteroidetes bacterium]|nr:NAD-dependent epimerase/dehydratase family protein [Bacteroidota bacterium]MCY4204409.1 NAD-dependent epimerase/dehydratase family protein [Bacteroidota bacterium]
MKPTTISILGCGFVGYPLAKRLLAQGWRVRGATTSESKLTGFLSDGIEPYLLKLTPNLQGQGRRDFFDSEAMVINFPPGRRRKDVGRFMEDAIASLLSYLERGDVQRVLFVSSTSVYSAGVVREQDAGMQPPASASGAALLAAEKILRHSSGFETTILRYAGLYGYKRKPGKFWSGRFLRNPENVVNMLHRDDAVGVAMEVIEQNCWGEIFNVCADQHPSRADFYTHAALHLNIPPPVIQSGGAQSNKVVIADKVKTRLGYTFKHPDPLRPAP